jgi:broad specificity phosphatase PhoE
MASARVFLVKHAMPAIDPAVPAPRWGLSKRGIDDARRLAEVARGWGVRAVYASVEPKAKSTALILGDGVRAPVHVVEGLEEQRWEEWVDNTDEFNGLVRAMLDESDVSIRGAEPMAQAAERFARAMALIAAGGLPAAVVAHGRVMTAWLRREGATHDAFALWRSMPLPGWAEVGLGPPVRLLTSFAGV